MPGAPAWLTAPARRASSKQAALMAPALGLSEAEVEADLEAGIDPGAEDGPH
jgi:hypothetical protein